MSPNDCLGPGAVSQSESSKIYVVFFDTLAKDMEWAKGEENAQAKRYLSADTKNK